MGRAERACAAVVTYWLTIALGPTVTLWLAVTLRLAVTLGWSSALIGAGGGWLSARLTAPAATTAAAGGRSFVSHAVQPCFMVRQWSVLLVEQIVGGACMPRGHRSDGAEASNGGPAAIQTRPRIFPPGGCSRGAGHDEDALVMA
ncbi:MAG TPA: hypothetical protein VGW38_01490 [Chloroflexota bacterium]|nr:hypothetical protein [Chloroflexota bacterium]